jgi:hypothetical protein
MTAKRGQERVILPKRDLRDLSGAAREKNPHKLSDQFASEGNGSLRELSRAVAAPCLDGSPADLLLHPLSRRGCCDPTGRAGAPRPGASPGRVGSATQGSGRGSRSSSRPGYQRALEAGGAVAANARWERLYDETLDKYGGRYGASGRTRTTAESSPGVDARAARPRTCTAGDTTASSSVSPRKEGRPDSAVLPCGQLPDPEG